MFNDVLLGIVGLYLWLINLKLRYQSIGMFHVCKSEISLSTQRVSTVLIC